MLRMRPVCGSTTTTDPLYGPSASTAAFRIVRSSPSMKSPVVESAKVGSVHGPPRTKGAAAAGTLLREMTAVFTIGAVVRTVIGARVIRAVRLPPRAGVLDGRADLLLRAEAGDAVEWRLRCAG